MSYLGIDLGTSGLRLLLVGQDGQPVASAEHNYAVSNPHPGWSEQDPAEWIKALETCMQELSAASPVFAHIRAIGVAGHMHGATLLDADGNVLRPCILWNDTRAHAEAAQMDAMPDIRAISGNIVFPGFTAPKLEWVRKHEPDIFDRLAKVLLPAAYLNFYLTGHYVADMSDSAGTAWLDVGQRDWSDRLLAAGHMRREQMPELVEGAAPAGHLRGELARRWGLDESVTIAGGAGDNAAAACGIGALSEGQGFVSLGTSGVLLAARNGYRPAPETAVHTFCHAVPEKWYQMGVMLSATDSLNWLSRISGRAPAELTKALGDTLRPPGTVRFLPYLAGERTPHNDPQIRGAFTGLSVQTDQNDLTQAVLEGVAFGLRDSLSALRATDARIDQLYAIGGGAASAYWLKLLATVLNLPLVVPKGKEFGAALGAARLAMIASGKSDVETVMTPPETSHRVEPAKDLMGEFDTAYRSFGRSYPAVRKAQ